MSTKNNISHQITTEKSPPLTANQLKTIFHANPVPTYIWQKIEKDFKLIDYNDAALSITMGKIKDNLGITTRELFHNNLEIANEISECFLKKTTFELTMPYLYKTTGEKKHLSVKYSYITPDLVVVFTKDISEWQLTETALKESENKYQTFIEKTQDGILIAQNDPVQIVFASPPMAEITGYSIKELKSLNPIKIKELIHLKNFAHNYQKQLKENQPPLHFEFCGIRKDGSQIWLSVSLSKINYGAKPCVLAIFKDITEREQAKEKLKKINQCFLNFGSDSNENIKKITAVCGELMEGVCALYNKLDKGVLCSKEKWQTPPSYNPVDKPEGHICYDVIKEGSNRIWHVRNLHKTKYQKTDPNVIKYNLKTYIGAAIQCSKRVVGAICAVYDKDFVPTPEDRELFGIIVSAIGVEEERLQADNLVHAQRDLAIKLNNTNDLTKGLDITLETALNMSKMDGGGIYLFDDITGYLHLKVHKGLSPEFVSNTSFYDADSKNVTLVKAGEPLYIKHQEFNVFLSDIELNEGLLTICAIPIYDKKRVIGCINMASHTLMEIPEFARITLETITAEIGSIINRLKAEQAQRESEETARALLDSSSAIEMLVKPDTTILMANEAAAASLGKSINKLIGTSAAKILPHQVRNRRSSLFNNVIQTGEPVRFEDQKKGKWFDTTFYPILDENGKVDRVAIYAHDITDVKKSQEEILRITKAVESSSDAIWISDTEGKPIYRNPAMTALLGYDKIKIEAGACEIYDDRELVLKIFSNVLRGDSWNGTVKLKTGKGEIKLVSLHADAVKDEKEKIIGIICIHRDISEVIKAQQEKVKFLKQLAKAEKLTTLGQAASMVVHEINNPLDIISTKLYMLEKSMTSNDQNSLLMEHVNKIKHQVYRLSYLANTILNYLRPQSAIFKTVDINNILQRAIESLSDQLAEFADLKINLKEKISHVNGDAIGLEIVFKNIILNALEARQNKIKIFISTKLFSHNFVEITIKDNGVGIAKKDLDNIFKTFFSTKLHSGGTGLGLAISRKIIKQHSGTINIKSKLNEGTTVSIQLPIAQ